MDSPEFKDPNFDPSQLEKLGERISPGIAFAPSEPLNELMEMQPRGLSLADVWMIRAAGITKEELNSILDQGFMLVKGPPTEDLLPGLLADHDLQLLEETEFNVQPIRKLMSLGYSVVFVDNPRESPESVLFTVDKELDRLDRLGFDIQPLKNLLDEGFELVHAEGPIAIDDRMDLDSRLLNQLITDGFAIHSTSSDSPPVYFPLSALPDVDSSFSFLELGPPSHGRAGDTFYPPELLNPLSPTMESRRYAGRSESAINVITGGEFSNTPNLQRESPTRNAARADTRVYNRRPPIRVGGKGQEVLNYNALPLVTVSKMPP